MYGGLPHAVFSLAHVGFQPTSVLMTGSHFISEYTMSRMLHAAILHSLWHDVWTNTTHDDVIVHIDWMLHSLLLRSYETEPRRLERPQHAIYLIVYACFAPWLSSLPHQRNAENPTWLRDFDPRQELEARCAENSSTAAATRRTIAVLDGLRVKSEECIRLLGAEDLEVFKAVWKSMRAKLMAETEARTLYNIRQAQN